MSFKDLSESKRTALIKLLQEDNQRLKSIMNGTRISMGRLVKLQKDGYTIEALIIGSQPLEHLIKLILRSFESERQMEHIFNSSEKEFFKLPNLDSLSLGSLIDELARFAGTESPLIRSLKDFQKKYRDRFVHKAFFEEGADLDKLDQEAVDFFKKDILNNLADQLLDLQALVHKQMKNDYFVGATEVNTTS